MDTLVQKGLVGLHVDGFRNDYTAHPPEALHALLSEKENILHQCLPDLENLFKAQKNKNIIQTYKGKEAIHRAYDYLISSLTPQSDYLVFGDAQNWHDSDPEYFDNWVERRRKIIKHGRSIFNDSPKAQEFLQLQKNYDTRVKVLPEKHSISAIKVITSKMVFIHTTGHQKFVTILENPDVVQLQKEMFDSFWDLLP